MLGPIFHLEMTLGGRRRRQHVLRWVLGGWLLLTLLLYFYPHYWQVLETGRAETGLIPPPAASSFGASFTRWILLLRHLRRGDAFGAPGDRAGAARPAVRGRVGEPADVGLVPADPRRGGRAVRHRRAARAGLVRVHRWSDRSALPGAPRPPSSVN